MGSAAASQAANDYNPDYGYAFCKFISSRIRASALTRSRQEWSYDRWFVSDSDLWPGETEDQNAEIPQARRSAVLIPEETNEPPRFAALREAVTALPQPHRWLVQQLFWERRTQTELAEALHLSQRAVSKRKQVALHLLSARLKEV